MFKLTSAISPAGDQKKAIPKLIQGLKNNLKFQTLFGATGTGKTFSMACVIANQKKPTLIIVHNKTLAAQLFQEYKDLFPDNKVCFFVSYYDYYQPEAYVVSTDTYIEKEIQINEEIDSLRHDATQALLTRKDVIVIATVSCIYGLGSPISYFKRNFYLKIGKKINLKELITRLIYLYFERTDNTSLKPGTFRKIGSIIEIMPVERKIIYRLTILNNQIIEILEIDFITSAIVKKLQDVFIFPKKHYVIDEKVQNQILIQIKKDLNQRLKFFNAENKFLEAQRLEFRTKNDLALIKEAGYCNGIENYSYYFSDKSEDEPPYCLIDYFPRTSDGQADFLTIIDESHITVPQISGMYFGDRARKINLINYGFRLPKAICNRPLKFEEFSQKIKQVIFTSATPGKYEKEQSEKIVEQIIRPTGLIDPVLEIRKITQDADYIGQVADFIIEARKNIKNGGRVIGITLTKKMSEYLSEYLESQGFNSIYLHSEITTLDRVEIISDFRKGKYDILIGVNLLREGLDLPEVEFIAIFDADKEGFLRSRTSLIQIIGRAARNKNGLVVLYADKVTKSITEAVLETNRRRKIQMDYNLKHNIKPKTILKNISDMTDLLSSRQKKVQELNFNLLEKNFLKAPKKFIKAKRQQMELAVKNLDFETAALIRDEIIFFENKLKNKD